MKNAEPSNLEDHIGYWLRCLSNHVHTAFEERLAAYGVTVAQWVVLRTLYDCPDVSLNAAAERVGVDSSSLSRMVQRLTLKGWVIRSEGAADRRAVKLALSAEARELVALLAAVADENDRVFFQTLSEDERQRFLQTIKDLLKANQWNPLERGKDRMQ